MGSRVALALVLSCFARPLLADRGDGGAGLRGELSAIDRGAAVVSGTVGLSDWTFAEGQVGLAWQNAEGQPRVRLGVGATFDALQWVPEVVALAGTDLAHSTALRVLVEARLKRFVSFSTALFVAGGTEWTGEQWRAVASVSAWVSLPALM